MKLLAAALILTLTLPAAAAPWKKESVEILRAHADVCPSTAVEVEEIVRNKHIKGRVVGLPQAAYGDFKVVFYVKTNRWYVHPYQYYPGQEEGYSYANLNARGEFKVRSILRDVPAQRLAVVLVPKPFKIRHQRWWLRPIFGTIGGVLKFQCASQIVRGNGDF